MKGLVLKYVEIHVEIQDMKNFQDVEIFLDKKKLPEFVSKHH